MTALAWIGAVTLAWVALGLVVVCVRERGARRAVAEFLLALVVGPALLTAGVFLRNQAPRAVPLSPAALARFAQLLGPDGRPAWLLGYRGRGLIVVRRTEGCDSLNNVPTRASLVRRGTRKDSR